MSLAIILFPLLKLLSQTQYNFLVLISSTLMIISTVYGYNPETLIYFKNIFLLIWFIDQIHFKKARIKNLLRNYTLACIIIT